MSVKVESTTDTAEDVMAAQGNLSQNVEVEKKPASEKTDEKELSASEVDTSSDDETDEIDGDENEPQDTENKPKKKKGGFKRRIDKLNTRLSEREKELAYWREQAMSAKPIQQKEESVQKVESKSDRPDPDNFETVADYTEALTEWKLEQRDKQAKETELKSKQQKEIEAHNKRVEAFAREQDDFWDVIEDVDDIQASAPLQQLILESDIGPQLMYEIASNRAEFERLNSLGALSLAREIGKLEAKLSTSKEAYQTETKKPTKAPAPLKTVGNKSSGTSTKSPDEMDFHEYKKWRQANL